MRPCTMMVKVVMMVRVVLMVRVVVMVGCGDVRVVVM